MLANALRGHLAAFGLIAAQGLHQGLHTVAGVIVIVRNDEDDRVPDMARLMLRGIDGIVARDPPIAIADRHRRSPSWGRRSWLGTEPTQLASACSQRLAALPGIGPISHRHGGDGRRAR
jgi:transposase